MIAAGTKMDAPTTSATVPHSCFIVLTPGSSFVPNPNASPRASRATLTGSGVQLASPAPAEIGFEDLKAVPAP